MCTRRKHGVTGNQAAWPAGAVRRSWSLRSTGVNLWLLGTALAIGAMMIAYAAGYQNGSVDRASMMRAKR